MASPQGIEKVQSIVSWACFPHEILLLTRYVLFAGLGLSIVQMKHGGPRSESSISQLLDAVEKRLDCIAETLRYSSMSFKCWL